MSAPLATRLSALAATLTAVAAAALVPAFAGDGSTWGTVVAVVGGAVASTVVAAGWAVAIPVDLALRRSGRTGWSDRVHVTSVALTLPAAVLAFALAGAIAPGAGWGARALLATQTAAAVHALLFAVLAGGAGAGAGVSRLRGRLRGEPVPGRSPAGPRAQVSELVLFGWTAAVLSVLAAGVGELGEVAGGVVALGGILVIVSLTRANLRERTAAPLGVTAAAERRGRLVPPLSRAA